MKNVKVFFKDDAEAVIEDVSDVRYEKSNRHNHKPDVLAVLRKSGGEDWSPYEVAAEFHRDEIRGWQFITPAPKGS